MSVSDNSDPTHLGRNTRIMIGNYVAEIFADEGGSETVFHWTVKRSVDPGIIMLGEQSTYDIARQEAEHHLARLADAEKAGHLPLRRVIPA